MPQWIEDVKSAFGLLSRLPLPTAQSHRAQAAWAWPLVGLAVGGVMAAGGWLAHWLGLPAGGVAALMLGFGALATGALHEDGLADCADGFFGGWTIERRLEIMKDSHIGSYGTLALLVVTLAKWSAMAALAVAGHWGVVVAGAVLSRVPMALIMAMLPPARSTGLSRSHGQPPRAYALAAATLALGLTLALVPPLCALVMALAVAIAGLGVAALARARIGGQTGDVLGASQQMAEVTALLAAAALIP